MGRKEWKVGDEVRSMGENSWGRKVGWGWRWVWGGDDLRMEMDWKKDMCFWEGDGSGWSGSGDGVRLWEC